MHSKDTDRIANSVDLDQTEQSEQGITEPAHEIMVLIT